MDVRGLILPEDLICNFTPEDGTWERFFHRMNMDFTGVQSPVHDYGPRCYYEDDYTNRGTYQGLLKSVEIWGIREPINICGTYISNGHHRIYAAFMLSIPVPFVIYS